MSETNPRERRVLVALTALVFVAFTLGCLYAIASPWQWGHNGFNGAAFCQAARNTLRFGIVGQAQYWTGLEPPPKEALYTHHPQLLHWHLVAAFKLFGASPLVGRLVPSIYSVLTLVLLHRVALRWWDEVTALVAIAIYAFTPLHTIFANMIDHEQGAIFFSLLALERYLRWLDDARTRDLVLCLVAISAAAQFDWPAYYLAFFVAVHAFFAGGRPSLRWRREWTFVAIFSLVVLANFVGFFLWIKHQRGTLAEMAQSFAHRTGSAHRGHLSVLAVRLHDLHGVLIVGLTLAWVPYFVARAARRKAARRDFLPAAFLCAQVLHSVVFKAAGYIHSYWTYWVGVASALGGAEVAVVGLRALFEKVGARRALRGAIVLGVALVVGMQARYAYARLRWGFANGSASYVVPYPDQRAEVRFARWLATRFERANTTYLVHVSLPVRIEFHWYTDAPFEVRTTLEPSLADLNSPRRTVLLLDLTRSSARGSLRQLVRHHPTFVLDRRFVAIEVSDSRPRFEAIATVRRPRNALWNWFVDPMQPPFEWGPDDAVAARDVVDHDDDLAIEYEHGRRGGQRAEWDCPRGEHVVALEGGLTPTSSLANVRAHCRKLDGSPGAVSPVFGGPSGPPRLLACAKGSALVGVSVVADRTVDAIAPLCAPIARDAQGVWRALADPLVELPRLGVSPGVAVRLLCTGGSFVRGLRMRSGALVDSAGIACGTL